MKQPSCIVYKTTNLSSNRWYIGVHLVNGPDKYLGSNLTLKEDVEKLGFENFKRETLFETTKEYSQELCYFIESHLVTQKEVDDPNCYNENVGGYAPPNPRGKKYSQEVKTKMSESAKLSWCDDSRKRRTHPEERKAKMRGNQLWKYRDLERNGRPAKGSEYAKEVAERKLIQYQRREELQILKKKILQEKDDRVEYIASQAWRIPSADVRKKMSISAKNRKPGGGMTGKKFSLETKMKMRMAKLGKKRNVGVAA